ncbi:MAG: undecaprenyl-diphosphate phosphatase [Myxococcota bacterium]
MNPIEAGLLGLVQGLTEFFPVSSSGHLALIQEYFGGREDGSLLFEVTVHVATLIAILFFYRRRIASLVMGFIGREKASIEYVGKLGVATLPSVVVGLMAKSWIESQFANPMLVAGALLVTGAIVFTTRWTAQSVNEAGPPTWKAAILIGVAQSFAILPGISRSGSTVAAALALGMAPRAAAEFSFLLGVIAITGAAILILPEFSQGPSPQLLNLGVAAAVALGSGFAALALFVRMLDRNLFHYWAWYCWAVGGAFLAFSIF